MGRYPVRRCHVRIDDVHQDILLWLTRGITDVLTVPLAFVTNLLAKGWKFGSGADAWTIPRLSWIGVVAALGIAVTHSEARVSQHSPRLYALRCRLRPMGQRHADAGSDRGGHPTLYRNRHGDRHLGLYRRPGVDALAISPTLDSCRRYRLRLPHSNAALVRHQSRRGVIATAVFAMPPMVRATTLALRRVPRK